MNGFRSEAWVDGAGHLELLVGGIESWPQLLPYLGRLQIEVLDVR